MKLISLGPRFAAELRGVDLIDVATNDAAYCAVREAFEEHSVILFRNQETSDDVQVAFSRAFGPLERTKVGSRGAGTFYVHSTNVAADATLVAETDRQALANRANQLWHTDSSFKATPALASVLSARTIPEDGGRRSSFQPGLHGTGCRTDRGRNFATLSSCTVMPLQRPDRPSSYDAGRARCVASGSLADGRPIPRMLATHFTSRLTPGRSRAWTMPAAGRSRAANR